MKFVIGFVFLILIPIGITIIAYGCTLNIIQTDTHGHAADISDVTSKDTANIEPSFYLP